jgi:cytoskeletal protein RodZ
MPEIGPTLREARMRAHIDITEVEEATKIRAKYLRAIENEEWGLLPGSTFVKSFVREYADYLGLDARLLVEEYKLRYERPSEHELPITPNLGRERRADGAIAPRWLIVGGLVLLLLVALWAVGSLGGSGSDTTSSGPTHTTPSSQGKPPHASTTPATTPAKQTPSTAQTSVRLIPTGTVYVCLVDQDGKVLIHGATFTAGQQVPVHRARSMRITLGNAQLKLRVNGRNVPLTPSASAISYSLTPSGAHTLPAARAPTCT